MELKQVRSKAEKDQFLQVNEFINKEDPNWIKPLDQDIRQIFDPLKNEYFKEGEVSRWLLKDGKMPVGRVAAFIHPKFINNEGQDFGGMGFFECINDQTAANRLFDACAEWFQKRNLNGMYGPVNFGEKDKWWGLLVEGFYEPTYGMNYNPGYYQKLFEQYGFLPAYHQYTYHRYVATSLPEKYKEKASKISQDPNYQFAHIDKNHLKRYATEFTEVYNSAWKAYKDFKPMDHDVALKLLKKLRPVMEEELIWFGYYKGEPIAFFIMMPELNQIFRHFNGKFGLREKLLFKWHQWKGTCRKMFGLAFGIVPEHQGIGVEGALITAAGNHLQPQKRWDEMEMTWIGDFNPKMLRIVESLGAAHCRTHITYQKAFN